MPQKLSDNLKAQKQSLCSISQMNSKQNLSSNQHPSCSVKIYKADICHNPRTDKRSIGTVFNIGDCIQILLMM